MERGAFMKNIALTLMTTAALTVTLGAKPLAAQEAAAGKEMYAKKCASCHGVAGECKDAIAKMLKVEMKPLASKEVQTKSDADLIKDMKQGVGKMKPVADLKDKDHQDIVAFLRALAKK
jgi:mono/diheme cytochrome c family protein